jgi:Ca2+-binding EF-hand superfamily protein
VLTGGIVEHAELEALYEQFKVLAASEYTDTKFGINAAISRETFDKCFIPNTHLHPPAPNLIYDRLFNFYDTGRDGLVDFEEFAIGVSLTNNKTKSRDKLVRVFDGYDLNGDGYVERKDFLRMFKAFYSLSKVLVRDIVASLGDELYEQGHMDQALYGRQPISSVFTSAIPSAARDWNKPSSALKDENEETPVIRPSSNDHITQEGLEKMKELFSATLITIEATEEWEKLEKNIEKVRRTDFWTYEPSAEDLLIPGEEGDIGNEVLFHMAMRGINELLDLLFKEKEKMAVESRILEEQEKEEEGKEKEGDKEGEKTPECEVGPSNAPEGSAERERRAKSESRERAKKRKDKGKAREIVKAKLEAQEEIRRRGGEGRLTFEEFEKIMNGPEASRLEFVSTWTDLASF